jgi:hypothetical protein
VEPAQPEQGPHIYERSAEAFQEQKKLLVEKYKSTPNNPMLNFLPIARRVMSQLYLEYCFNQRPYGDICFDRSNKRQSTSHSIQQNQQQEEVEFDKLSPTSLDRNRIRRSAGYHPALGANKVLVAP